MGVVGVRGTFEAGDAVEIESNDAAVGKGISNYSAGELRRVMGMQTRRVREVLPTAAEEAVHRDYFVLAYRARARGLRPDPAARAAPSGRRAAAASPAAVGAGAALDTSASGVVAGRTRAAGSGGVPACARGASGLDRSGAGPPGGAVGGADGGRLRRASRARDAAATSP